MGLSDGYNDDNDDDDFREKDVRNATTNCMFDYGTLLLSLVACFTLAIYGFIFFFLSKA